MEVNQSQNTKITLTYYHVVIEVCPEDCIGNRVKDFLFSSYRSAYEFYKNCFSQKEQTRTDFANLYDYPEWANYYKDENSSDADDCNALLVSGEVALFSTYDDITQYIGWNNEPVQDFKFGEWYNDYDEICDDGTLFDTVIAHGAKTYCSFDFSMVITENDILNYSQVIEARNLSTNHINIY